VRNAKTPVRVVSLIVLVLMLLVIAPSVLAYTYYATFSMSNNSTTSYTSLPVQRDVNNLLLVTQGFMSSSGLDSRVETAGGIAVPHMVADNRTFAVADSSARSNNNLYYTTGSTPLSSFYIIPGYGGYFSVADTVPELTNNGTISLSVYTPVGTSCNLADKPGAFRIFTDTASNNVTFRIFGSTSYTANITPNGTGDYTNISTSTSGVHWQDVDDPVSTPDDGTTIINTLSATEEKDVYNLASPSFLGSSVNITSVSVFFRHLDPSAGVHPGWVRPILRLGTSETLGATQASPAAYTTYSQTLAKPGGGEWVASDIESLQAGVGIQGDGVGYIRCTQVYVQINYTINLDVTLAATYALHSVIASLDGTNSKLTIDGTTASVALGGYSVTDYSSSYTFCAPYYNSANITKGGNLVASYQPNAIILGTNLPDRTGNSHNGTFVWGANPSGVSVNLGSLVSSSQPVPGGSSGTTDTPDIVSPAQPSSSWFGAPDLTSLAASPLYFLVGPFATLSGFTETQVWRFYGAMLVLLLAGAGFLISRGHMVFTGAGQLMGFLVCWQYYNIFPFWTIILSVIFFFTTLVMERSPTV
jgi:hypothetical protein